MASLHLEVVTPGKAFFNDDIDMVIVRGIEGDLAILKDRAPIATPLKIGIVKIYKDDLERVAAVLDGYITFIDNKATIVTEAAEWPGDINLERAQAAKERAEKILEKKESGKDLARAEYALKRALNRIEVCKFNKENK